MFNMMTYLIADVCISEYCFGYFVYCFLQNCNLEDLACPSLHVERLCFEMDKSYEETKLQLLLSPCVLIACDNVPRDIDQVLSFK